MKTMTCKQLGGACDMEFQAATFEEMMQLSKQHGTAMFQKGDYAHLKAMKKMKDSMNSPDAMAKYMEEKRKAFEALPNHT
ncbi:MAG: DUF1059 domain-containing protein [Croceitalea sp.]|nr:DUF1059 domain-containing protein [Croceitalea sp.]NNL08290.1 DUF1059 domain-containing protein [Croceitalea sp.]NNM18578.1 DUF1059 domain-containing protein [Croceitalea sp.]